MSLLLGYECYLTISERTIIKKLVKNEIKKITKISKESDRSLDFKSICNNQKQYLARILSKVEHLFPHEEK